MHYGFKIVDKLSAMNELDRYQVERISWLRLSHIEQNIRRVQFEITPGHNSKFECEYHAQWTVELKSGNVVTISKTKGSIGEAVIASANRMNEKVFKRIAFEGTLLSRIFSSAKERVAGLSADRSSRHAASCS